MFTLLFLDRLKHPKLKKTGMWCYQLVGAYEVV